MAVWDWLQEVFTRPIAALTLKDLFGLFIMAWVAYIAAWLFRIVVLGKDD